MFGTSLDCKLKKKTFYVLLGLGQSWKLLFFCNSPCVYVKAEDMREIQNNKKNDTQNYIKSVSRLQKFCFKPSREANTMCASDFLPGEGIEHEISGWYLIKFGHTLYRFFLGYGSSDQAASGNVVGPCWP